MNYDGIYLSGVAYALSRGVTRQQAQAAAKLALTSVEGARPTEETANKYFDLIDNALDLGVDEMTEEQTEDHATWQIIGWMLLVAAIIVVACVAIYLAVKS